MTCLVNRGDMSELPSLRHMAPFAYFPEQSSAFTGLGGQRPAPDPRYCFHTAYEAFNPGLLSFELRLLNVRASCGELTVRVHAFRPNSGLDVSLVASAQYKFEALNGETVEIPLRVAVIPDVCYAVYGYLSEPSDLSISGVTIAAQELGGDDHGNFAAAEPGRSRFGAHALVPSPQLIGAQSPQFSEVSSQPMTDPQLEEPDFHRWRALLPREADVTEAMQWSAAYALEVLEKLGFSKPGSRGVLVGNAALVVPQLSMAGCQLTCIGKREDFYPTGTNCEWIDANLDEVPNRIPHCDFAISFGHAQQAETYPEWLECYNAVMRCLLRDGIGVFMFNYWPDSWGDKSLGAPFIPNENHIARIALHAIGHGSKITQMQMCPIPLDPFRIKMGHPFALVVIR